MLTGNELNVLVAKRVTRVHPVGCPNYSGDVSAAFTALDSGIQQGFNDISLGYDGSVWTAFVAEREGALSSARCGRATDRLAATALCLALLHAVDPNSDGDARGSTCSK